MTIFLPFFGKMYYLCSVFKLCSNVSGIVLLFGMELVFNGVNHL